MSRRQTVLQALDKGRTPGAEDTCWEWARGKDHIGYGVLHGGGRRWLAHRAAYSVAYLGGLPIPKGMVVMHSCDNPGCCNPRHLILGTQAENIADRVAKGRTSSWMKPGEAHHAAKLTEADVIEIRSRSMSAAKCAEKFGVSQSLIFQIRAGTIWKVMADANHRHERRIG